MNDATRPVDRRPLDDAEIRSLLRRDMAALDPWIPAAPGLERLVARRDTLLPRRARRLGVSPVHAMLVAAIVLAVVAVPLLYRAGGGRPGVPGGWAFLAPARTWQPGPEGTSVIASGSVGAGEWSPSEKYLAITDGTSARIFDANGAEVRRFDSTDGVSLWWVDDERFVALRPLGSQGGHLFTGRISSGTLDDTGFAWECPVAFMGRGVVAAETGPLCNAHKVWTTDGVRLDNQTGVPVALSADGTRLVVTTRNGAVMLVDPRTSDVIASDGVIMAMGTTAPTFSPDDRYVAYVNPVVDGIPRVAIMSAADGTHVGDVPFEGDTNGADLVIDWVANDALRTAVHAPGDSATTWGPVVGVDGHTVVSDRHYSWAIFGSRKGWQATLDPTDMAGRITFFMGDRTKTVTVGGRVVSAQWSPKGDVFVVSRDEADGVTLILIRP